MSHSRTFGSKMMLTPFLLIAAGLLARAFSGGATPVSVAGELPSAGFVNSGQSLGGETGNGVALGDLDGDGDTDAFVANDYASFGEANQVWLNDGDGSFTRGPTLGEADGTAAALGDLDSDGDLDAIVTTVSPVSAMVWINRGGAQGGDEGDFAAGVAFGSFSSYAVALGDIDDDDDLDALVVGNENKVWLNDGSAAFTAGPVLPFVFSRAAVLADLDDDGWLDAVIADSGSGSENRVYWNDGNWAPGPGTFTSGDPLPTGGLMNGVAVGRLDADTRPDVFLVGSGPDQIFWNEGARTLSSAGPLSVSDSSWAVALADADGNGLLDAVVGNINGEPNRLWRNEGGRVFTVAQEFGEEVSLYWTRGLGLADLNGDTSVDLFEVTTADDRVWFSTAQPRLVPNEEGWQIQTVDARGDTGAGAALVVDTDGHPHIAYVSTRAVGYDDERKEYAYEFRLHYARWDGVRWHTQIVPSGGLTDLNQVSLALDGNSFPHIVYDTSVAGRPDRYIRWNGTDWVDERLFPTETIDHISLAIDSNGVPHLSYARRQGSEFVQYAVRDGADWRQETLDTTTDGTVDDTWLVLDSGGNPHVSYSLCPTRPCSDQVRYAHREGGAWQTEFVGTWDPLRGPAVSLELDGQGRPHIAFVADGGALTHAYREGNTWQRQVADSGLLGAPSLDLDSAGNAHLFYLELDRESGTNVKYARWDGASWRIETLDFSGSTDRLANLYAAVALDANDTVHASYQEPRYGDLRYVTWAPNWQIRDVAETGTVQSPAMDVQAAIPHIGYYSQTSGQVTLASWDTAWDTDPLAFVSSPVSDLAVDGGADEHVSFYDADNQRLLYARRDRFGDWQTEVVDETGDVGRFNDLLLVAGDFAPRIAYWDATSRRVKLAVPDLNVAFWNIYPNLAAPPLGADGGPLSMTVLSGGDIGVAYYDGANGDLRLGVWAAATGTWTDELVDGTSADVGRLHSLQTDGTDGAPVVAYLGQGAIRMAYKLGGLWQRQDVPGTAAGDSITGLSLELGLNSRQNARIAYTTQSGLLRVAVLRATTWQIHELANGGSPFSDVASALDTRLHLAFTPVTGGVQYAFRTATLNVDTSVPGVPSPSDGYYNPLNACQGILDLISGDLPLSRDRVAMGAATGQPSSTEENELDDLGIFGALTGVFNTSESGRRYVDLYREHGSEMGLLGLNDPGLLWDAHGTLQNFLPGLEALVTGRGDEVVVTQEMVDDARDIWMRLAAVASPALASAIRGELAKYDNLQDFVGLSFSQWASEILEVPPAACPGDCNGNGQVAINELVLAVNIALELQPVDLCLATDVNNDRRITVNELVRAVNSALRDCA